MATSHEQAGPCEEIGLEVGDTATEACADDSLTSAGIESVAAPGSSADT